MASRKPPGDARRARVRLKNAKRWAEAEKTLIEAREGWPEAKETGWIAKDWANKRLRWAQQAIEQGDLDTSARLIEEVMHGGPEERGGSWWYLDIYRDHEIACWRRASAKGDSKAKPWSTSPGPARS